MMTYSIRAWGYEAGDLVPAECEEFDSLAEAKRAYRSYNGNEVAMVELWDDRTESVIKCKGWFNNPIRREMADRDC